MIKAAVSWVGTTYQSKCKHRHNKWEREKGKVLMLPPVRVSCCSSWTYPDQGERWAHLSPIILETSFPGSDLALKFELNVWKKNVIKINETRTDVDWNFFCWLSLRWKFESLESRRFCFSLTQIGIFFTLSHLVLNNFNTSLSLSLSFSLSLFFLSLFLSFSLSFSFSSTSFLFFSISHHNFCTNKHLSSLPRFHTLLSNKSAIISISLWNILSQAFNLIHHCFFFLIFLPSIYVAFSLTLFRSHLLSYLHHLFISLSLPSLYISLSLLLSLSLFFSLSLPLFQSSNLSLVSFARQTISTLVLDRFNFDQSHRIGSPFALVFLFLTSRIGSSGETRRLVRRFESQLT